MRRVYATLLNWFELVYITLLLLVVMMDGDNVLRLHLFGIINRLNYFHSIRTDIAGCIRGFTDR